MAKIDSSPWDASKAWSAGAASDNPAAFYKAICAGEKSDGDPSTQKHWALPHHYHPGDPPNAAGVRNGLSRISSTQGLKNKSAAQKHLDSHMTTIQAQEKAAGRKDIRAARAEHAQRGELPGGNARTKAFPGKLSARLEERNGKQFYHLSGFATVFERGYPMWDMFGEYTEIMDYGALSKSLAANPDVNWLVNHKGVTMARTTNGTLDLSIQTDPSGYRGLHADAWLNPDRTDVRDIVSAVVDGLVDEMSFAFMLNEGEWNDDYTEFRIMEADINRGDVSAVNYGANPYTSIQARTAEVLADIGRLPPSALSRAQKIVAERIFKSAAVDLSQRSSERYQQAAERLEQIADSSVIEDLKNIREWAVVDETGDDDPDDNAADLAKAVDASLDTAVALFATVDVTSLPPAVQQGIDLVNGAESNIDELLEVMNLPDPDDSSEERSATSIDDVKRSVGEIENPKQETEPPLKLSRDGKPVYLWSTILENLRDGKI